MVALTGEGRACIPVGLTKTWDGLINWTKCVWKVEERRKNLDWTWAASNLDLRSNAYRSLPGGQVISSSYFHVFLSIGP